MSKAKKKPTLAVTFIPREGKVFVSPSVAAKKTKTKPPKDIDFFVDPFPQSVPVDAPPPKKTRAAHGSANPDAFLRSRRASAEYHAAASQELRDIAPIFPDRIDWKRRLACSQDLNEFERTYVPAVFKHNFSRDQLACNDRIMQCCRETGSFGIAMPRAQGKSSLCRGGITWATVNAYKNYVALIGSSEPNGLKSYKIIKGWMSSPKFVQDFPEVCYPILRLGNNTMRARGQLYDGLSTFIEWGDNGKAMFPSITLPDSLAEYYHKHLPGFLIEVETVPDPTTGIIVKRWMPRSAGTIFEVYGIDSSIRGTSIGRPYTNETLRPDLCLLDDVQRDTNLDSETAHERLVNQIEGSIQGLAGPDSTLSVLMACTIQKENDVSSLFTDPVKKPDYVGKRFPLVDSWPDGINDYSITLETKAGELWTKYEQLRNQSLQLHGNISLATQMYAENREVMDDGFSCSWAERYDPRIHLSAQQYAMEQRFKLGPSFPFEMQNRPRKLAGLIDIISSEQLKRRVHEYNRRIVPPDATILVAHIDIGDEMLYYTVFATDPRFNGAFVDYGTWPEAPTRFFKNYQVEGWSMLTTEFFKAYPDQRKNATFLENGRPRAPRQAKIYFGLGMLVNKLLSHKYVRADEHKTQMNISRIGIDTKWGAINEASKRFIRESQVPQLLAYQGQSFPPTRKQLEHYNLTKGWLFEHEKHPSVKESKWVFRQTQQDNSWYLQADVDRQKDFLFQVLGSPLGSNGVVQMFNDTPENHDLFATQVCNSEYPEAVSVTSLTKNMYLLRPNFDNDFLDCSVACMSLASYEGACIRTTDKTIVRQRRNFSEMHARKRA